MTRPADNPDARFRDCKADSNRHLSNEHLLRLVDGELLPRETETARAHLEACWSCRARQERIHQAITAAIEYRNRRLKPYLPPPAVGRARFVALMEELANESPQDKRWSFSAAIRSLSPQWLAPAASALVAVAFLATLMTFSSRRPAVSAESLLQRSKAAEHVSSMRPGHVTHRVVVLEERAFGGSHAVRSQRIETWEMNGSQRSSRRLYSDGGKLIAGVLLNPDGSRRLYQHAKRGAVDINAENPLAENAIWQLTPSAESFAKLAENLANIHVEERPSVYVLYYAGKGAGRRPKLLNASLTLRRSDLHAIEQTLQVEEDGKIADYRFVETAFEQRPAAEVPETAFAVDAKAESADATNAAVNSPTPVFLPAIPDLQVDALSRLDRTDALLQGEAMVSRAEEGGLLIQGLVDTEQRRNEVLGALGPLAHSPAVHVAISTPSEVDEQQFKSSAGPMQVQSIGAPISEMQGNADLRRYFSAKGASGERLQAELQQFADSMLDHLAEARKHASVLREILNAFSPDEIAVMTPESRKEWCALIANHARSSQRETKIVQDALAPVFDPFVNVRPAVTLQDAQLPATASLLYDAARRNETTVWKALAAGNSHDIGLRSLEFWKSVQQAQQLTEVILQKVKH